MAEGGMGRLLPVAWFAFLFLSGGGAPAGAGFDDGAEAYARGRYAQALALWQPLAERGDVEAQLRIGEMLRDGLGVRWKDFEQAAAWFRRAAAQGQADAQYALGRLHYEGFIIPRDTLEMRQALAAAARQGHARAQLTLGVVYEYGLDDIGSDLTEALKWYELAARHRVAELDAKIARLAARVRAKMTTAQIAAALRLAKDWDPAAE
jgi:TPR repeat protein